MLNKEGIASELVYKAVRSSGSGGQHVNKVSTKVELHFNITASNALNEIQQTKLLNVLGNRITKNGILIISCDETRSQLRNKTIATRRLFQLLEASLKQREKGNQPPFQKLPNKNVWRLNVSKGEKKAQRKPPKFD
jgi:ribosome-associated protein